MKRPPATPGIRLLKEQGISFTPHEYAYSERGGAPDAAVKLGLDPNLVIKTLVFETQDRVPFLVLMHGDRSVSAKGLARILGLKSVTPCAPKDAERHTGYQVGGISPFGTRRKMQVYVQASVMDLPVMYINGGRRGLLLEIAPPDMQKVLNATVVEATAEEPAARASG